MGVALEAGVPAREFLRRIQPFGIALAEISWQVKMYAQEGVVLAALYLEEPDVVVTVRLWPDADVARRLFKGSVEIRLRDAHQLGEWVRLAVQIDPGMVEEMFVAASLMNDRPSETSARRAEEHFADCLALSFPSARLVRVRSYTWREAPECPEFATPIRVG